MIRQRQRVIGADAEEAAEACQREIPSLTAGRAYHLVVVCREFKAAVVALAQPVVGELLWRSRRLTARRFVQRQSMFRTYSFAVAARNAGGCIELDTARSLLFILV